MTLYYQNKTYGIIIYRMHVYILCIKYFVGFHLLFVKDFLASVLIKILVHKLIFWTALLSFGVKILVTQQELGNVILSFIF